MDEQKQEPMTYELLLEKEEALNPKYREYTLKTVKENIFSQYHGTEMEILTVGRFLEGLAVFHETLETYLCVGWEIKIRLKYDFMDQPMERVGFYSIWKGKSSPYAPINFEQHLDGEIGNIVQFINNYGDCIDIQREIV